MSRIEQITDCTSGSARSLSYAYPRDDEASSGSGLAFVVLDTHGIAQQLVYRQIVTHVRSENMRKFYSALCALSSLKKGWDSYEAEAPNNSAIERAEKILDALEQSDFFPERIIPSSEGGIAIAFTRGKRYADIECFNDGEILIGLSGGGTEAKIWETNAAQIDTDISKIRAYLQS